MLVLHRDHYVVEDITPIRHLKSKLQVKLAHWAGRSISLRPCCRTAWSPSSSRELLSSQPVALTCSSLSSRSIIIRQLGSLIIIMTTSLKSWYNLLPPRLLKSDNYYCMNCRTVLVTIPMILILIYQTTRPPLPTWSSLGSAWQLAAWRAPWKSCPSSSMPAVSSLSLMTGLFPFWYIRSLSMPSKYQWFNIRLPSLNMMKMQLYVFTQIIDLIEADQVRIFCT